METKHSGIFNWELLGAKNEAYSRACKLLAHLIDVFDALLEGEAHTTGDDKRNRLRWHAENGSREWLTLVSVASYLDLVCASKANAYTVAANAAEAKWCAYEPDAPHAVVLSEAHNAAVLDMRRAAFVFFAEAVIEVNAYSRRRVILAWPLTEFGEIPLPN